LVNQNWPIIAIQLYNLNPWLKRRKEEEEEEKKDAFKIIKRSSVPILINCIKKKVNLVTIVTKKKSLYLLTNDFVTVLQANSRHD